MIDLKMFGFGGMGLKNPLLTSGKYMHYPHYVSCPINGVFLNK